MTTVTPAVDETFADAIVCPGFIDQHLHPILSATTLVTEVIATEDWALPGRTFPAAHSEQAYQRALRDAEQALTDPRNWLISWGYHPLWHGPLDRAVLDEISRTRPIAVWHRSCHESFSNSAAIAALDITHDQMAGQGRASGMVDLDRGHWWETGKESPLAQVNTGIHEPRAHDRRPSSNWSATCTAPGSPRSTNRA